MNKSCFFHFLLLSPVILLFLRYLIFPKNTFSMLVPIWDPLGPPKKSIDHFWHPLDAALAPEHASRTASGPSKNRSKQKMELLKKHLGFPSKVEPWRTLGDPGAPPNRPHGPAYASRGPPASELGRQTHVLGPSLGPPENPTGPHLTKHMIC